MRRTTAAALLGLAVLSGCGGGGGEVTPAEPVEPTAPTVERIDDRWLPDAAPITVPLPDDREVLCVWAAEDRKGGLSCDWENTTNSTDEKDSKR